MAVMFSHLTVHDYNPRCEITVSCTANSYQNGYILFCIAEVKNNAVLSKIVLIPRHKLLLLNEKPANKKSVFKIENAGSLLKSSLMANGTVRLLLNKESAFLFSIFRMFYVNLTDLLKENQI